ncbi:MAG TPA: tetratricopeptide repeat protein [Reyranella sp.]|jgi:Flp pilus assembly protein TadD
MRSPLILVALAAMALSGPAFAMGSSSDPPEATKAGPPTDYSRAKAMIEAKNFKEAIPLLQQVVAKEPKNAEAYNLLGYATRKSGDPNGSLQYYTTALQIDPKHLGANEYLGEAYLMLGKLPQAEQQLARLDQLCMFGCVEYRTLKTAIADYKSGRKPTN